MRFGAEYFAIEGWRYATVGHGSFQFIFAIAISAPAPAVAADAAATAVIVVLLLIIISNALHIAGWMMILQLLIRLFPFCGVFASIPCYSPIIQWTLLAYCGRIALLAFIVAFRGHCGRANFVIQRLSHIIYVYISRIHGSKCWCLPLCMMLLLLCLLLFLVNYGSGDRRLLWCRENVHEIIALGQHLIR